ncbi:MAG TPA: hypothetical protein VJY33_10825, partial [Isosphaeraceae bacterium]|nr:hypothetical protein [Isosphaeraceae bacterium]
DGCRCPREADCPRRPSFHRRDDYPPAIAYRRHSSPDGSTGVDYRRATGYRRHLHRDDWPSRGDCQCPTEGDYRRRPNFRRHRDQDDYLRPGPDDYHQSVREE